MTISPEAAFQIAVVHQQSGRISEAEAIFRQIVAARPEHADAWQRLGLIALSQGRPADAATFLERAVAIAGQQPFLRADLGVAYWLSGRGEEAIATFQSALALQPGLGHVHRNLGDALLGMGRVDEALASYERAVALTPHDAGSHNNLGNALMRLGRLEEAAACYRRATELDPRLLPAQSNLGDTLTKLGRPREGLACAERVLSLDPNFPGAHLNMGVAWWHMGEFEQAEVCYRRAVACDPQFADGHLSLGVLLLLLGRFEEGWREYEWRWRSPAHAVRLRGFTEPTWDGSPLPGQTLLLHADQGLGDTLQFLRYLPLVEERLEAGRIILECQAPLIPLLKQIETDRLAVVARSTPLPPFAAHVSLLSLPLALHHAQPVPFGPPLLQGDPERRARWRERLGTTPVLRVGIAWAGNPAHDDDRRRSIEPEQLLPILEVPGIQFVSLQIDRRGSAPASPRMVSLFDPIAEIHDFADSAALVAELDLIISVDTATVHLAGVLARPVWTLLPFAPDWRWGLYAESTEWYPTMRLFRQPAPGDWDSVVARVAKELPLYLSGS